MYSRPEWDSKITVGYISTTAAHEDEYIINVQEFTHKKRKFLYKD